MLRFQDVSKRGDASGSRVLDALLCSQCGEVYFGGYRQTDLQDPNGPFNMVHDQPDLDTPSAAGRERFYSRYAVFWPSNDVEPLCDLEWGQGVRFAGTNNPVRRMWVQAFLNSATGELTYGGQIASAPNGWLYRMNTEGLTEEVIRVLAAMPSRCCRCDEDWTRVGGNTTEDATSIEEGISKPMGSRTRHRLAREVPFAVPQALRGRSRAGRSVYREPGEPRSLGTETRSTRLSFTRRGAWGSSQGCA